MHGQRIDYIRVSTLDQHTERSRGCKGGCKFGLTKAQVRLAQTAMKNQDTSVSELCWNLGGLRARRSIAPFPPRVNCANMESESCKDKRTCA
jgi:hypothetical protein